MSKEYIEREATIAFLENMAASRYLIQCFEDKERFPAADVAPVIHGKWIHKNGEMYCSVCGSEALMDEVYYESPYCPDCGAIMDGGSK